MSKWIFVHKHSSIIVTVTANSLAEAEKELNEFLDSNLYKDDFDVEEYNEDGEAFFNDFNY